MCKSVIIYRKHGRWLYITTTMADHSSSVRATFTILIPSSHSDEKNEATRKKRDKEKHKYMKDIKEHVCALLNTGGGTLRLKFEANENISSTDVALRNDNLVRAVEQTFHPVIGTEDVSKYLTSSDTESEIILQVKGHKSLCTLNYHMYLPTDKQVLPVICSEIDTVIGRMNFNRVIDVTDFEKDLSADLFVVNSVLSIKESKTVQFKCLKSEKSQHNDLASRIISNKFTSYVSAFANCIGGRIFVGIDRTGRVVGETVLKSERRSLEARLKKHVDSMLWPEHCTPPVKGAHWDIAFHTVLDSIHNPVETESRDADLCVIVITIYACAGGVFTKEPESYYVVKDDESQGSENSTNKVESMSFTEWKSRLLYPEDARDIPRSLSRCDWSSHELRKKCDELDGKLLRLINFGKWTEFEREAKKLQPNAEDPGRIELELVLLSKWYVYHYRKGKEDDFQTAEKVMVEFETKSSKSNDNLIFEIRGLLCLSALQRTRGYHEDSYRTAKKCLSDVETLTPCILTAEFYVHFATMLTIIEGNVVLREKLKGDLSKNSFKEEAIVFYSKALEHLRRIDYVPLSKADMQQKSHINLAILTLGCSLSGDVVDHVVSKEAIEDATTCLKRVEESRNRDGNPLSDFRSCHHKFANSSLHYRRSQHEIHTDKRMMLLRSAIRLAKEVKFLANECTFHELSNYACRHVKIYENELEQLKEKYPDNY